MTNYGIRPGQRERAAARREQTRLQRIERAQALGKAKAARNRERRPEQSPEQAAEAAAFRREQIKLRMRKAKCAKCAGRFVVRGTGEPPQLCAACALAGPLPKDFRWGTRHVLAG